MATCTQCRGQTGVDGFEFLPCHIAHRAGGVIGSATQHAGEDKLQLIYGIAGSIPLGTFGSAHGLIGEDVGISAM